MVTFHYLFPQLTMGLAALLVAMNTIGLMRGDERYRTAARFWTKLFAINFVLVVVTGVLLNPWGWLEYAHTMNGSLVTAAFVVAAVGALYLLNGQDEEQGRLFVRVGVVAGIVSTVLQIFPTGDEHARYLARHQPATTAAMEGLFRTRPTAP